MRNRVSLAVAFLLGCMCAVAQGVEIKPVEYLKVKSPEVVASGEGSLIFAEFKDPEIYTGLMFESDTPFLKVWPEGKYEEWVLIDPLTEGGNKFLIEGDPGQVMHIEYLEPSGRPARTKGTIPGDSPPPKPDPTPAEPEPSPTPTPPEPGKPVIEPGMQYRDASKKLADAVRDDGTRRNLKLAIERTCGQITTMCDRRQCPTVPRASEMVQQSITTTLGARQGDSRYAEWSEWLKTCKRLVAAKNPADPKTVVYYWRELAAGL